MKARYIRVQRFGGAVSGFLYVTGARGEYLKEVNYYVGDVKAGYYRISRAPKTGRFGFVQGLDPYGDMRYQLRDHKTGENVYRPAGGSWCANEVVLYMLANTRFNIVRVSKKVATA